MSFQKDLWIGTQAENFVIQLFNNGGWRCENATKGNAEWDIKIFKGLLQLSFEVKFDKMSEKTGNIAIEYFNPKKNKESGLTISTADFWIYCWGNPLEAYLVSLKWLKKYIDRTKPFRHIDKGGDNNASLLLYKRDKMVNEVFWRIDNISIEELNIGLINYINNRNPKIDVEGNVCLNI